MTSKMTSVDPSEESVWHRSCFQVDTCLFACLFHPTSGCCKGPFASTVVVYSHNYTTHINSNSNSIEYSRSDSQLSKQTYLYISFTHATDTQTNKHASKGRMAPSNLSVAIASNSWDKVTEIIRVDPKKARQWNLRPGFFDGFKDAKTLPLHEAVTHNVPAHIVRILIEANPAALQSKESSYRRLPLHCACRKNADPDVIRTLLLWDTNACMVPDTLGRVPLHYALSNGADAAVIDLLLRYGPNATAVSDMRGWLPLHVACGVGVSVAVITMLIQVYPESVHVKTAKGSDVIRTVSRSCVYRDDIVVSAS
jgi:hypothetical protein